MEQHNQPWVHPNELTWAQHPNQPAVNTDDGRKSFGGSGDETHPPNDTQQTFPCLPTFADFTHNYLAENLFPGVLPDQLTAQDFLSADATQSMWDTTPDQTIADQPAPPSYVKNASRPQIDTTGPTPVTPISLYSNSLSPVTSRSRMQGYSRGENYNLDLDKSQRVRTSSKRKTQQRTPESSTAPHKRRMLVPTVNVEGDTSAISRTVPDSSRAPALLHPRHQEEMRDLVLHFKKKIRGLSDVCVPSKISLIGPSASFRRMILLLTSYLARRHI